MLFASEHPLVRHKLALLRHVDTEPKKFRELVRELSMLLCYEATRDLELVPEAIPTPMGSASGQQLRTKIGLIPILRAGLGMVAPILDLIPTAHVWHLGLYRDHATLEPVTYYNKLPARPNIELADASRGQVIAALMWSLSSSARRIPDAIIAKAAEASDVDCIATFDERMSSPGVPVRLI